MNLNQTLGLANVDADPNSIPDGKYNGKVLSSRYVLSKEKNKLSHVITYQVTEGTNNGAQKAEFFHIGDQCKNAQGGIPQSVEEVVSFNPLMSEANKQWYKKRWVDLGIPEDQVPNATPEHLVDRLVTFGVKRKDGYQNINFVEVRTPSTVTDMAMGSAPVSLGDPAPTSNPFETQQTGSMPNF